MICFQLIPTPGSEKHSEKIILQACPSSPSQILTHNICCSWAWEWRWSWELMVREEHGLKGGHAWLLQPNGSSTGKKIPNFVALSSGLPHELLFPLQHGKKCSWLCLCLSCWHHGPQYFLPWHNAHFLPFRRPWAGHSQVLGSVQWFDHEDIIELGFRSYPQHSSTISHYD